MDKGTGIWQHDGTQPIAYFQLLNRFFKMLHSHNPSLLSGGSKTYTIPPPQCLREGNKKTLFANIADICSRLNRSDVYVTLFLFAELGKSGSVDVSKGLVIKGRFRQMQIENVLRRYIQEDVVCKTCHSPHRVEQGRVPFVVHSVQNCGSRRSVTAIMSEFSAQVGRRRRQQG